MFGGRYVVNNMMIASADGEDGWRGTGRPKKRWMDCVRNDMKDKGVNDSVTVDRGEWKKKTCCADPK